ncbi:MAG: hypothetical protein IID37_12030 [Planctomycetes bacterium]|nr:hypothetical protein [Planctomycetota bacterium]
MDLINNVLLWGGDVVASLWQGIKDVLGAIFSILGDWAGPVLSWLLALLNPICAKLADVCYAVLSPLPVWAGLTIISAVTGVLMLGVFRYTSNQTAIKKVKDDIKANLLCLKLYKDSLGVMFRAQAGLVWAAARQMRYMLFPFLVMLPPMLLMLAQMGVRYQWRPLQTGERMNIEMTLADALVDPTDVALKPSAGMIVEAGPVAGDKKVVWRVRGGEPGRHLLEFVLAGATVEKEIVIGNEFGPVSAKRMVAGWTSQLFHPIETLLVAGGGVSSIELFYPGGDSWFSGPTWWMLSFFVISMAFALIFKPLFKVTF